ncbi:MAG: TRAM domain-containing protein [Candidatus Aenigmarchaeota archaeon]|nr:TRAM domain-containing protein [Candidatus Aenigmarchaeota archaeon]
MPKPIKAGEEYDVEIKEVGSKGDGIARVSNFVVFVNGAKMGEKLHIKITDVKDRFAIGEKTEGSGTVKTESTESTEEVKETSSDDWDSDEESDDESSEESNEDE